MRGSTEANFSISYLPRLTEILPGDKLSNIRDTSVAIRTSTHAPNGEIIRTRLPNYFKSTIYKTEKNRIWSRRLYIDLEFMFFFSNQRLSCFL